MRIGDIVYAERRLGSFWIGLIIKIDYIDNEFYRCRVMWNDGEETWEDEDSLLDPEQKKDLEEMADKECPG